MTNQLITYRLLIDYWLISLMSSIISYVWTIPCTRCIMLCLDAAIFPFLIAFFGWRASLLRGKVIAYSCPPLFSSVKERYGRKIRTGETKHSFSPTPLGSITNCCSGKWAHTHQRPDPGDGGNRAYHPAKKSNGLDDVRTRLHMRVKCAWGFAGTYFGSCVWSLIRWKFCFMWIEYLFCFGQMSFWLFEFRNIGKFGDYLVDNVLKIEKI